MPPRAVLLDLYDTVVDSDWYVWRDLLAGHVGLDPRVIGRAFTETRPARSVGTYADEEADVIAVLEAAGLVHDPAHVKELVEIEREFMAQGVRLFEESLPVVRELRARGVKTALVSNCSHNTRPAVAQLGLHDEFDAVLLSVDLRARKPHPEIYQAALEAVRVGAADAVFVDDQAEYCDGARALGIDTRLILRRDAHPIEGVTPDTNGHTVIRDLTALLKD
jgi:haloacid dehalogenase superfamily, subfamily IA, variant 3 with third motif having DD or ED